jgi:hypothetical protein
LRRPAPEPPDAHERLEIPGRGAIPNISRAALARPLLYSGSLVNNPTEQDNDPDH